MKKPIVIALIALGVLLALPGTRPAVLDLLGPVTRPVLNPVFRWSAEGEMTRIARELTSYERVNDRLPESAEFTGWIGERMGGGSTTDPWGSRYALTVYPHHFIITSPGPDLEFETSDDLQMEESRTGSR